ncbi:branched-subunit amino acid transport protein [Rubricella aquisinus]|uniref:Branched-subunit amino acid transport protein n=1 Tax=Rubricella aquisinus TaxID=2028108 RepID=A0A840WLJ5_9RHOB|nr:AzlD domain-containing protein [Rubricella aquisinus]MBB5515013.1 branched-subunit amino acid transport protein [Rubricella aquisinus]
MSTYETIWTVIILMGIGTFLIRFSFLGLAGGQTFPEWVLRLLRYVPVAVMPGLVAPLVLWPSATGGEPDIARLGAAAATLLIGAATRNMLGSILGGMAALYILLWLT